MWYERKKKWWEKLAFFLVVYPAYWAVFYGSIIVLPYGMLEKFQNYFKSYGQYYVFGLVPFISLLIPIYLRKKTQMNLWVLYLIHIVIFVVYLVGFFTLYYYRAYTVINPEGFVK